MPHPKTSQPPHPFERRFYTLAWMLIRERFRKTPKPPPIPPPTGVPPVKKIR